MSIRGSTFFGLVEVMDRLRAECPWDRKQTIESLRLLTIEELYELTEAISMRDWQNIKEELGDILLHILFYSKLGEEAGKFTLDQMIESQIEKLKVRHPHIYGDLKVTSEAEVKQNWEKIKMKTGKKRLLSGVPSSLPAMVKAYRLQDKTAQVGFEWDTIDQVWDKVMEEIEELKEVLNDSESSIKRKEEELGDVLFALVNLSRFMKVDPDHALERINQKFKTRFEFIEDNAYKPLGEMTLSEMDDLWNKAKLNE